MYYPSDIVDQVFKFRPDEGLACWEGDADSCSHCARPLEVGDLYSPSNVGQFFSDTRDLACGSRSICWRCVVLRKKPMLYGLSSVVITPTDAFPISKDVHKAWLFTTPPPAPFLVLHSSSTMQHLSWRTPITFDARLIKVRFGPTLFTVRPAAVREALRITDHINEGEKKFISPMRLDRKAAESYHGMISRKAKHLLSPEHIEHLANLTAGERWGLAYLMHSKRPVPEQPEPITQKILDGFLPKSKKTSN